MVLYWALSIGYATLWVLCPKWILYKLKTWKVSSAFMLPLYVMKVLNLERIGNFLSISQGGVRIWTLAWDFTNYGGPPGSSALSQETQQAVNPSAMDVKPLCPVLLGAGFCKVRDIRGTLVSVSWVSADSVTPSCYFSMMHQSSLS